MKVAAVSELKAKLAKYLRMVKTGEEVEIQDRGIPVAILHPVYRKTTELLIIPPRKKAENLSMFKFSVKPAKTFDVTKLVFEERSKR